MSWRMVKTGSLGAISAVLLAGCAVTGPPQFAAEGAGLPEGAMVALVGPDQPDAQDNRLADALTRAFTQRGFTVTDRAGYVVRYSIAERPARVALARENEFGSVDTISYPRTDLLLDRCEAQRMRVNVVAYDLAEGVAAYRGTAEFNDCRFEAAPFDNLAREIAQRASR